MCIKDPEQGREIQELEQRQNLEKQHHHHALPDVREALLVPDTPGQPPEKVEEAWKTRGLKCRGSCLVA